MDPNFGLSFLKTNNYNTLSYSYVILGRRGIEPNTGLNPFFEIVLNVFFMNKTFSVLYSFLLYRT